MIPAGPGLWDNLVPFPSDGDLNGGSNGVPVPADRQSDQSGGFISNAAHPIWIDADYAGGFLVASGHHGFDLFDVRTEARKQSPVRIYALDGYSWRSDYASVDPRGTPLGFENLSDQRILKTRSWGAYGEFDKHGVGAAAKEFGGKIYLASFGTSPVGMTVWEFDPAAWAQNPGTAQSAGAAPRIIYAATGTAFDDGTFAMAKGPSGDTRLYLYGGSAGNKLYTWDISAAIASPCLGSTQLDTFANDVRQSGSACSSTIFQGVIAATGRLESIDVQGASPAALSVGRNVISLNNGASPTLEGTVSAGVAYTSAMWRTGGSIGMAVRGFIAPGNSFEVYDVTNMVNGSSSSGVLRYSQTLPNAIGVENLVSGQANSRSYLWLGEPTRCSGRIDKENLWDVTTLTAVNDITPSAVQGGVTYFSYYYPDSPTGFDFVFPGGVDFSEDGYLFRSMQQLVDTHLIGDPSPTLSLNGTAQTFHGDPTVYTATATNCTPIASWIWSTDEDTGANVTIQNNGASATITWNDTNVTSDLVRVSNSGCQGAEGTLSVAVSDPSPNIIDVRMNGQLVGPSTTFNIPQCTDAVFTTNTIGRAPLAFTWSITPTAPSVGSTAETLEWSVGNASGLKALSLEASNNGGADTDTFAANLQIVELSNLGFSAPPTVNQTGTSGTLSVDSNSVDASEWQWETSSDGGQTFAVVAAFGVGEQVQDFVLGTGTWVIRVTARNCDGGQGEVVALTNTITVLANPPVVDFRATDGCTFAAGQCLVDSGVNVGFSAENTTGATGYRYDLTHTGTTSTTCSFSGSFSSSATTSQTYTTPTTYHPCVEANGPGGTARALGTPVVVSQASPPAITINCSPSSPMIGQSTACTATASNCTPTFLSWNWSSSGGGTGTSNPITLQWSTSGSKQVTASHPACGSAIGRRTVTVTSGGGGGGGGSLAAVASVTPASPMVGETVTFDGSSSTGGAVGHSWVVRSGASSVATYLGETVTHTFTAPGTYSVELSVTDDLQCLQCYVTDTVSVVVSGEQALSAAFTMTPPVPAQGENVVFNGGSSVGDIVAYLWTVSPPTGPDIQFGGQTALFSFEQAGLHTVTLEVQDEVDCASESCSDSITKTVDVTATEELAAIFRVLGEPPVVGRFFTLDASPSTGAPESYLWEVDGQEVPGQTLTLRFDSVGSVPIKLTVTKGSESDSVTQNIEILGDCDPTQDTLCLSSRRFKIEVEWTDFEDNTGVGMPFEEGTTDSGLFWFFSPSNAEMLVKIIDACDFNNRYWFSVAATTNVAYTVRATDVVAHQVYEVSNPAGNPADAVVDTDAFATCDFGARNQVPAVAAWYYPAESAVAAQRLQADRALRADQQRQLDLGAQWATDNAARLRQQTLGVGTNDPDLASATSAVGTCVADNATFCFVDGRFAVSIQYRNQFEETGAGLKGGLETGDSGVYYFFAADNWEFLVKMVDGCSFNDNFWVFAAATTDQEYTLTVTDTMTGAERTYFNPLNRLAPAITDTEAFPCQ